jgi:hypothetical protein
MGRLLIRALLALLLSASAAFAADPLPSWNDGPAKREIIGFVEKVAMEGSPFFVPAAERIAVFDNDGTEQPLAVTAIDILLEPDAMMLRHAKANNDRLLKVYPNGFALDATHRPHITLIQRFVRTEELGEVYAAAGKVFASTRVVGMKLEAFKYYYAPAADTGVAGIVARLTPELIRLQQDVIDAVAPFTVDTGPWNAFITTPDDPNNAALINYVRTFVPAMTGEHFSPHVSIGVAPRAYLDKMLAEPFEPFTFSPAGAAVYQLGQFGTAAKKLKEWHLKQ